MKSVKQKRPIRTNPPATASRRANGMSAERDDPIPDESAESKRAEDPDDREQKATDDGMAKRTHRDP